MRRMSAPASARAMAIEAPMPRVPPVTRAVWPSREKSCWVAFMVVVVVVDWLLEWWCKRFVVSKSVLDTYYRDRSDSVKNLKFKAYSKIFSRCEKKCG
jgi:hypothetical protein